VSRLGGIVSWDPSRRADTSLFSALLAEPGDRARPFMLASGAGALAATVADAAPRRSEHLVIAADADLLNTEELRRRTGVGDASVAVARLLRSGGEGAVRVLRGAFAIALWDEADQRLLLAVDHFGIKRLYYAVTSDGIAFSSRSGGLRAMPGVGDQIDVTAVYEYLNFGFVPAPRSIWKGVRRLPPGHLLVANRATVSVRPYWNLEYTEQPMRLGTASRATRGAVSEAVAAAVADRVPKETGAFLSGGTDSSTVVGLMGELTGERANAFSIGFREPRYDELSYATLAARRFGASHYTRTVTADEALAALPGLVAAYDEPFGNNSAIGTFFCAQLARESGVSCLLAGDGGDEIFGGNERYRIDRVFGLWQRLPGPLRTRLLEPVLLGLGEGAPWPVSRAQRYVRRAAIPNPDRFYSYEFFFAQEGRPLLATDFVAAAGPDAPWQVLQEHFARARAASELNRLMYLDIKLTLGDNDLLKVTRTAELAGITVRFPLLDVPLVAFTATLPAHYKVRGFQKRYLFKKAFRGLLPPEILAKRKHGFGVPTGLWLKTHRQFEALARETLLSPAARQRGYFRAGGVEELLALHAADTSPFYGDLLWTLLMLELWHEGHARSVAS
jgi:asparagine synthase (glutamine-hydrolysing)